MCWTHLPLLPVNSSSALEKPQSHYFSHLIELNLTAPFIIIITKLATAEVSVRSDPLLRHTRSSFWIEEKKLCMHCLKTCLSSCNHLYPRPSFIFIGWCLCYASASIRKRKLQRSSSHFHCFTSITIVIRTIKKTALKTFFKVIKWTWRKLVVNCWGKILVAISSYNFKGVRRSNLSETHYIFLLTCLKE